MIELIQSCWPVNDREAKAILQKFIHVFGTEGAENHLKTNAFVCKAAGVSYDDYIELCKAIERIMNTGNTNHDYFVTSIGNLIMAKCT